MTDGLIFSMKADVEMAVEEAACERALELALQAPLAINEAPRPVLNLALVIDRSGSMTGEKLEFAKGAACYVVDLLTDDDLVAVVSYDSRVLLVSPSTRINPSNRDDFKTAIRRLEPGSSTNLSGGWLMGCEEVARAAMDGSLNRTLLLTDGLANNGITNLEELGFHAGQLQGRGVSTSTFGVGLDFNEHLLEHMANQGGGNFYFIEDPRSIASIFQQEFKELAAVTARDVEIQIELPQDVTTRVIGGWKNSTQGSRLSIWPGDMVSQQQRQIYLLLNVPPFNNIKTLEFEARVYAKGIQGEIFDPKAMLTLRYEPEKVVKAAQRDPALLAGIAEMLVAEAFNEALKLERDGERETAYRLMNKILLVYGEFLTREKLAYYQEHSNHLRRGMDEPMRKGSQYDSYTTRHQRLQDLRNSPRQRPDPNKKR